MATPTEYKRLILVPTRFELEKIQDLSPAFLEPEDTRVELCGFGPVVAAARSAELIARFAPQTVLLVGIAGTYSHRLPVGAAATFCRVGCFGVGVGFGAEYQSATATGWKQWACENQEIGELIELASTPNEESANTLVTVTSSASCETDIVQRTSEFADADAEDMEGFGVAVACQLANKPLTIVRGISNFAGDRNKSNWRVDEAIASATKLADRINRNQDEPS